MELDKRENARCCMSVIWLDGEQHVLTIRKEHFWDAVPFDWSNPKSRALRELLASFIYAQDEILALVAEAGIKPHRVKLGSTPELTWHNILEQASKGIGVRALVQHVAKEHRKLAGRLAELESEEEEIDNEAARDGVAWHNDKPIGEGELERIFGKSALLDVGFLALGLQRAKAVVRLGVHFRDSFGVGTGFLIAKDRVLTNHHVLFSGEEHARAVDVWLGYETEVMGAREEARYVERLGDASTIRGIEADDWATIELTQPAPDAYAPITLSRSASIKTGDRVYIVQHPAGGPKQIGIHKNLVRHVDGEVVQYFTDTQPGSSGSPVFDKSWEVVALHHCWMPVMLSNGRVEMRNEAIHIQRVIAGLTNS